MWQEEVCRSAARWCMLTVSEYSQVGRVGWYHPLVAVCCSDERRQQQQRFNVSDILFGRKFSRTSERRYVEYNQSEEEEDKKNKEYFSGVCMMRPGWAVLAPTFSSPK